MEDMFFQVVLHTLSKYEEWNRYYQWIFPQAYDGRWTTMHYSNA
jgi:hypothetical protein